MSVFCAAGSPRGVRVSGYVFDFVESILNVGLQGITSEDPSAIVDVQTCVYTQDWLRIHVFGPLQKLEQTHPIRGSIAPWAHVCGALLDRTYRFLPVEAVFIVGTLKVVSAWEPKERRLHRYQQFHDVNAIAVGSVLVSWWKQRHQTERDRPGSICGNNETVRE